VIWGNLAVLWGGFGIIGKATWTQCPLNIFMNVCWFASEAWALEIFLDEIDDGTS